jgi:hypothetical protein
MTLLKFDGFEGYSSPSNAVGKGGIINSLSYSVWSYQTGRNGGKCLRFKSNNLYPGRLYLNFATIPNTRTAILGFAVKFTGGFESQTDTASPFLQFGNSTSNRFILTHDSNGNLGFGPWVNYYRVYDTVKLESNRWYYMEIKYKCHNTEGIAQFRLDEQLLMDYSGDTYYTGGSSTGYCEIRLKDDYANGSQYNELDDMYLADTEGTENNDFLGNVRIDTIHPNGAGNYTQLTPSAGNNYECVDETGYSSSDYVEGANAGEKDSYTYGSVPTDLDDTGIYALQIRQNCKRTAPATNIKIDPFLRTGSTDYSQTAQDLSDGFTEKQGDIVIEDPSDSNPWTQAKINACEFGMEVA